MHSSTTALIVLVAVAATAFARPAGYGGARQADSDEDSYGPAQPYEFSYNAEDPEGSHGHSQSFDGTTVRGHYMIMMADGTMRKVEYHADENGFHAKIVTNELGTESKNPADVVIESSAPTGEEAARQYGAGSGGKHGKASKAGGNAGWN